VRVERLPEELIPTDLPAYYREHFSRYSALLAKRRSELQVSTPDTTDPLHAKRVKATVDMLFLMAQQGFKSVLEIGSGPGYYTYRLAYWFTDLWACDAVPDYVEVLKRIDYVTPFVADANTLELTRDFDVIVACEVLEHLRDPQACLLRWLPRCKRFIASSPIHEPLNPEGAFNLERLEQPIAAGDTTGHIWSMDMEGFLSWFAGNEILSAEDVGTSCLALVRGGLS
jgi:SAM-dependent methyltransferase